MITLLKITLALLVFAALLVCVFIAVLWLMSLYERHVICNPAWWNAISETDHDYGDICEVCGSPVRDFFVSCASCGDGLCRDCAEPANGSCLHHWCPACAEEHARRARTLSASSLVKGGAP